MPGQANIPGGGIGMDDQPIYRKGGVPPNKQYQAKPGGGGPAGGPIGGQGGAPGGGSVGGGGQKVGADPIWPPPAEIPTVTAILDHPLAQGAGGMHVGEPSADDHHHGSGGGGRMGGSGGGAPIGGQAGGPAGGPVGGPAEGVPGRHLYQDKWKKKAVVDAFVWAWDAYGVSHLFSLGSSFHTDILPVRDAWGSDEYHPLSKQGSNMTFEKGFGYTIVDTLDTLWLMELHREYDQAKEWVRDSLNFEIDGIYNVFEVRLLFPLLAYDLTRDADNNPRPRRPLILLPPNP
jgi:hypothetical protein